ncbi:hypothetical protein QYE76_031380 [Lolium multiflorum]|uniref:CCHC-type domain-containing protein n=1 Tax=Lolium multiflorum TaxID=4521 RepID=A0AAD8QTZ7_LOLMU|nr:hypothetical protein QYE76_031380 [Lolium multiflorum]
MTKGSGDPSKKPSEQKDEDVDKLGTPSASSRALTAPRAGRDAAGSRPRRGQPDAHQLQHLVAPDEGDPAARRLWNIIDTGEGDYEDDRAAKEGILRSVPAEMIPMSAVKETARLKICEEDDVEDEPAGARGGGQLLTEEQRRARMKGQESGGSSGSGGGKNRRNKGRDTRGKGQAGNNASGAARDDECRYCGKLGHWARDCRKKKREEAHLVKEGEEEGQQALLMAQLCPTADEPEHTGGASSSTRSRAKVRLGDEREPWTFPGTSTAARLTT